MYQYPYGNAQQLNLDWLMEQWQTVKQSIDGSLQGEIDRVEAAITDLLAARDAAVAAAGAANTSAGAAAASAQAAAADAATASAQAAAANTARSNAAQAANNAQAAAGNAQTQAAAAQNAAGQAAASASQAAADASDAHDDALAASGSAVNAAASAAGALQNFQLSDAARQAAQAAEQDAEAAATLLQPPATSADIGKALIVKTVGGGTVTAYELGESGGGGTPAIVQSIEDVPIASFDDGTVNPVQQLVVDIEPVQAGSGDPAPDNVRPITGWTGANMSRTGLNLWAGAEMMNDFYAVGRDSTKDETNLTVSFKGNSSTVFNAPIFKENTRYTFIFTLSNTESSTTGTNIIIKYTNNTLSYIDKEKTSNKQTIVFVSLSGKTVESVSLVNAGGTTTIYCAESGLLEGVLIADDFVPYTGTKYTIAFPTETGTVYGGTLTNQGTNEWKLKVEYFKRKLKDMSWRIYSNAFFTNSAADYTKALSNIDGFCNVYTPNTSGADKTIMFNSHILDGNNRIRVVDTDYTTIADFITFLTNIDAEIVTRFDPVEYTFTTAEVITLLADDNNVWADTGNINLLQYYADSKKYIDEQDALIKALIAPVLDGMVADTALTANDFRIVDNTLYRITAPVAAGAALTPNTNCTATTIGAILKTLLT